MPLKQLVSLLPMGVQEREFRLMSVVSRKCMLAYVLTPPLTISANHARSCALSIRYGFD